VIWATAILTLASALASSSVSTESEIQDQYRWAWRTWWRILDTLRPTMHPAIHYEFTRQGIRRRRKQQLPKGWSWKAVSSNRKDSSGSWSRELHVLPSLSDPVLLTWLQSKIDLVKPLVTTDLLETKLDTESNEDPMIEFGNSELWLYPAEHEPEDGPDSEVSWTISEASYTPATRWQPEDVDVQEHGPYNTIIDTLTYIIQWTLAYHREGMWEHWHDQGTPSPPGQIRGITGGFLTQTIEVRPLDFDAMLDEPQGEWLVEGRYRVRPETIMNQSITGPIAFNGWAIYDTSGQPALRVYQGTVFPSLELVERVIGCRVHQALTSS